MSWQKKFVNRLIAEYQFSRDIYIEEKNLSLESRFYTDEQMEYAKENLKHTQRLLLGLPKQLIKKFGIDVSWE